MKAIYETTNGRISLERKEPRPRSICPCCGRAATVRIVYRDRYGYESNNLCDSAAADLENKVAEAAL